MNFTEEDINSILSSTWVYYKDIELIKDEKIINLREQYKKYKEKKEMAIPSFEEGKCYIIRYMTYSYDILMIKVRKKESANYVNVDALRYNLDGKINIAINSPIHIHGDMSYREIPEELFQCVYDEFERLKNPIWINKKRFEYELPIEARMTQRIISLGTNEVCHSKILNDMTFSEFQNAINEYNKKNYEFLENMKDKCTSLLVGKKFIIYDNNITKIIDVKNINIFCFEHRLKLNKMTLTLECDSFVFGHGVIERKAQSFPLYCGPKLHQVVNGEYDSIANNFELLTSHMKQINKHYFNN